MMSPPKSLKREFFKKLVMGLRICKSWSKDGDEMSVLDRKNAIKLSADVAIASARNCSTSWSRALICNASSGSGFGRRLVQQMLGRRQRRWPRSSNKPMIMAAGIAPPRKSSSNNNNLRIRWRSPSSSSLRRRARRSGCARSVANSLMRKRSEVLKRLVPGGRFMDGIGLIEETLDYIVALRAQVDVMRSLVAVPRILNLHGN